MTPMTLTIRRGSRVLNDAQDFDLAMWSTQVKVDQFANHVFQRAKRAGNRRRSIVDCVAFFFYEEGKCGENFREKDKFRCKVKIVILQRTLEDFGANFLSLTGLHYQLPSPQIPHSRSSREQLKLSLQFKQVLEDTNAKSMAFTNTVMKLV